MNVIGIKKRCEKTCIRGIFCQLLQDDFILGVLGLFREEDRGG